MASTTTAPPPKQWLALVPFLVAVAVVAALGGWAASSSTSTYRALDTPPFAPPSWLFGPVWTVLYVLMAVAAWQVWRVAGRTRALTCWVVQLVLNLAWTPLFFAADQYELALVDILLLLGVLVLTTVLFGRVSRLAAWLLMPYIAWVAFATALTIGIVVLN